MNERLMINNLIKKYLEKVGSLKIHVDTTYKLSATHDTETENKCPKVSIILLNWNGWQDSIECLDSLYNINYTNYDIIFIDNGSKDDSVIKIKDWCSDNREGKSKIKNLRDKLIQFKYIEYKNTDMESIRNEFLTEEEKYILSLKSNEKIIIIKNEKNYGFAEGCNIGIRFSLKKIDPDYILLLNNDTTVDPNFLSEMVKVAETDQNIGIIGPKIVYYDNPKTINQIGGYMNYIFGSPMGYHCGEIDNGKFNESLEVSFLSGASLLIRKNVFKDIGLFDSIYFVTHEETDFEFRCQKKGYKLVCVPNAKVCHKISRSLKKSSSFSIYYKVRNRIIFMKRYASKRQQTFFFLWFYFIELPFTFLKAVTGNKEADINLFRCICRGVIDGFREFKTAQMFYE